MTKKTVCLLCMALTFAVSAFAQDELPASAWGNNPPLHVEGKYLCDPYGNHVTLHGVMDTPSAWFNSGRWGWPNPYSNTWAKPCINYFKELFDAITDSSQGAYCNLFRLHLDPCWTNDPNKKSVGTDAHGNSVGGEANISQFSKSRLKGFLRTVYVPIALEAIKHGMYVIMRPPGVFPADVWVGDYYNQYIVDVWDIVTQNDSIKKYSGQISIELGNEPVRVHANGGDGAKALCDFFQPAVDKIRANGFDGIVWGVGTGWQGNYRDYAKYPLVGKNIGYAVHNYVGWYGGHDQNYSASQKEAYANECRNSWPIMDSHPIVITEVDWSPEKEGTGHTNEHGDWVLSNYGTWATGSTSKWGSAYKYMMDKFDNVSMTLSGTDTYIDYETYHKTKKVAPAFAEAMKKNKLDPMEASGAACMAWYAEWAKKNYARPDLTNLEAPLTELTCKEETVTHMVGQSIDLGLEGKFEDGLTSKIPAWLCNISGNDENVCGMCNDKLVAVGEGTSTVKMSFAGKGGEGLEQECNVEILPAFTISKKVVNPSIMAKGTYASTATRGTLKTAPNGMGGWEFDAGIDLSAFNYLVMEFYQTPKCAAVLHVSDNDNPAATYYMQKVDDKLIKIDLKNMLKSDGTPVDAANIKVVAFKSNGSDNIYIKNVFLSMDGETSADAKPTTGISTFETTEPNVVAEEYYNAAGIRTAEPQKGVNILRQTLSNGHKRTIKVMY